MVKIIKGHFGKPKSVFGRTRHEIKAKNTTAIPLLHRVVKGVEKVTGGTVSYDANVWEDILEKFSVAHGISKTDVVKIIAFCFPLWGGREPNKEGGYRYWVMAEDILESRMGWAKFKRELDMAINRTKSKLQSLDKLWVLKKEITDGPELPLSPSFYTDDEDIDNLLYGISDDE